MKRPVLFAALLLSVLPAGAAPKNYGTITTRDGKSFYQCKVMRVYPDGVTFAHRDGAVKIPFAELPESLRSKFHHDPKAEAEYQKEQAALRKAGQERQKQQEIVAQERLMDAKLAEASRLAATSVAVTSPQTLSRGSGPIASRAVVSRSSSRSRSSYSRFGYYGSGYYSGGYSSGISYCQPYSGYSYGGHSYSGQVCPPTVIVPWNLGQGIHIGTGGCGFSGLHPNY
jgi:hypothetical protein